jgi:hypothetical protein
MKLTTWIRRQVKHLEHEIGAHSVFSTSAPATHEELVDLRSKVALHTYLKQQLLRRELVKSDVAKTAFVKTDFPKTDFVKTDSGRFEAVMI